MFGKMIKAIGVVITALAIALFMAHVALAQSEPVQPPPLGPANPGTNAPSTQDPGDEPYDESVSYLPNDEAYELGNAEGTSDGRSLDGVPRANPGVRSCGNSFSVTDYELQLMQEINRARANNGRVRLCARSHLVRSSRYWARYMANNNVFYHGGLDYVCPRFNYCGRALYENLGYQNRPARPSVMFDMYLASNEGHREAIMGPARREMGTGWATNNTWAFNAIHLAQQ